MIARTLEEIEALAADAMASNKVESGQMRIMQFPRLLAIAQEQRAEIARLQDNASTAAFDKIADQLGEANRENEEQRARIQAAFDLIAESGCDCDEEDREFEDVHICLAGRIEATLKGIGTKK